MTGFGHATAEDRAHSIDVTARSYNHKFLDVSVRLRDEYVELESQIRALIKERLDRGRIEIGIEIQPTSRRRSQVEIDRNLVSSLERTARQLSAGGTIASHLTMADLLRLPGAVTVSERFSPVDDQMVLETVSAALGFLEEARVREGSELAEACSRCATEISQVVSRLQERRTAVVESARERLTTRLGEFASEVELDSQRLHQEVTILIDRSDIREELDRLSVHQDELQRLLGVPGPVGKRLGFLCQEILRELNTIASKSRDSELTAAVLDGKVICDQIREQALNVE